MLMRTIPRLMCPLIGVAALLLAGCMPDKPRLNSPPQGNAKPHHAMSSYYAYHNDQAMLADMSIADLHFVPHTSQLSSTGEARLERYAELLATSGGTINYTTSIVNQKLVRARLAAANEFMKEAVPGTKGVKVALGGAGGRGMTAAEASLGKGVAKQPEPRNTAYHLNKKESGSSSP
jgi:hypothetical protein